MSPDDELGELLAALSGRPDDNELRHRFIAHCLKKGDPVSLQLACQHFSLILLQRD